ncbi:DUF7544 domain-containing protein [Halorussus halophilus]|uniref:DUF7544 domain-containing protein n=1 Tax=Halorussus halophilus TaxID=2650975 RepID=UPI0013016BE0|nr:hypothetical protein [Halorussus halophilus]
MSWYAVDAVGDAYDVTKQFLAPLDARQWLKLALVVFFLGGTGGTGGPSASFSSSSSSSTTPANVPPFVSPEELVPVVLAVAAVAFVLGLLYLAVGSLLEFVFVESLRRRRVKIRRDADQHFERGVQLFGFRVALGLLVGIPALGVVLAVLSVAGGGPFRVSLLTLAVLAPLLVLLGFFVALVDGFTTNFVVPTMIQRNAGVLDGWRTFWRTLREQWRQFGVYVLVRFVLSMAVGLLASIVGGVVGAVLFAPLAVFGVVFLPAVGGIEALFSNSLALAVAGLLLVGYVVTLLAVLAIVLVPVQTYLRYHSLLVLGDANSSLDLIPDLRRKIRSR